MKVWMLHVPYFVFAINANQNQVSNFYITHATSCCAICGGQRTIEMVLQSSIVRGLSGKYRYTTCRPIRKFLYAYYGNTAVDLDPLPVNCARLIVIEPGTHCTGG